MELTIEIDVQNKDSENLIAYLKSLSFVKFPTIIPKKKKKKELIFEEKIKEALKQVEEGKTTHFNSAKEAQKFCDSL